MGNVSTVSTATVDDDTSMVPAQQTPVQADTQVTAQALAQALDPRLAARLAAQARAQGVSLLGRDGLLQQLTKRFLEAALAGQSDRHLCESWKRDQVRVAPSRPLTAGARAVRPRRTAAGRRQPTMTLMPSA